MTGFRFLLPRILWLGELSALKTLSIVDLNIFGANPAPGYQNELPKPAYQISLGIDEKDMGSVGWLQRQRSAGEILFAGPNPNTW